MPSRYANPLADPTLITPDAGGWDANNNTVTAPYNPYTRYGTNTTITGGGSSVNPPLTINGQPGQKIAGEWYANTTPVNVNGTWYKDGQPYTGKLPDGSTVKNGTFDPAANYQAIDIVKNQPVADASAGLLKSFNAGTNVADKTFTDLLNEAKTISGQMTDINKQAGQLYQGDLNTIAQTAPQTINDLRAANEAYNKAAADQTSRYNQANADYAKQQQAAVDAQIAREQALLPQFNQSLTNIGNEATNAAIAQVGRYKLGTGTPTSLGSDEQAILGRNLIAAQLPLEQARIAKQYELASSQGGLQRGTTADITNRITSGISGYETPLTQNLYAANTDLPRQINALKMATVGMGLQEAQKYLTTLGVPIAIIQQVLSGQEQNLSGQISNLSGISGIDAASRYQGLNYIPGMNISQPAGYSPGTGRYPTGGGAGRYAVQPVGGGTTTSTGGQQYDANGYPITTVGNTGLQQWQIDQRNQQSRYGNYNNNYPSGLNPYDTSSGTGTVDGTAIGVGADRINAQNLNDFLAGQGTFDTNP